MYGQGNYGNQTSQGFETEHHLLADFPPPTSALPNLWQHRILFTRWPPAAVPSQINQLFPMYGHVPRGPPHVVDNGPPFQGPSSGMTNTADHSYGALFQPLPVLGRMPVTGPFLNSQCNSHYPLHVETQNSHHFPTPSPPPPPPAGPFKRQPPATVPSQINQLFPMYSHVPRGPPHVINNCPPFQGPTSGMTDTTDQHHACRLQPSPVCRRMPITGSYLNSQSNPHHHWHVGTQNSLHFPTPSASPPPPAGPSNRKFSQAASLPPLVQEHITYWHPVNSQPQQPSSVQGPPLSNPNSGLITSLPAETHTQSLAPPPPPPLPLPLPFRPAKRKTKKRKSRLLKKIRETSTTQGDTGAEVPCSVLQVNKPEVKDNITCSSGNSCQSLEREKIQPAVSGKSDQICNESNLLPAKRKNRKRKRVQKIQETGTTQVETGDEVPYSVLQANEPEVKDNITCPSGNFHQSLEHEKIQPSGETNWRTMKRKEKRRRRRTKKKEAKAAKNASRKNGMLSKNTEELFHIQTAEEHVSCLDKFNCNGEASVDSGLVSCFEHSDRNGVKVNRQINEVNPLSELLVSKGDATLDIDISTRIMPMPISDISPKRTIVEASRKKLLILDLNGLLADIIPYCSLPAHLIVSRKAVFKRPFVDDFLQFCFEKFAVGVWSSRTRKNLDPVVKFVMGDYRLKLLFCWDQSHCTKTGFTTVKGTDKPLFFKELRKLWEKLEPNLPWEKGTYNESNTLLLDGYPCKALRNPANTGIFPYLYRYEDVKDNSLGPGGDLRVYLENLALADDLQKYIEENPYGQRAITELHQDWDYYKWVLDANPPEDATSIRSEHISLPHLQDS